MKKKDLIKILEKYPDEIEICTYGYEGGYISEIEPTIKRIKRDVYDERWYGPHEEVKKDDECYSEAEEVIVL